ncbi:hypothetical protein TWF281_007633 [Arthrobotrys megalospora]
MVGIDAKKVFGKGVVKGVESLMSDYASNPTKLLVVLNDSSQNSALRMKSTENGVDIGLAPCFGALATDIGNLDERIVGVAAMATKEIERMEHTNRTFEKIRSTLLQNQSIEGWTDRHGVPEHYYATDALFKSSTSDFKSDRSQNSSIVSTFINKLINDPDVVNSLQFDNKTLAKIVSETGATVRDFEVNFSASEYEEKTILEVLVLRYPDLNHQYLKLYRVKFTAIRDNRTRLFYEEKRNCLRGEVDIQKFRPRDSIWDMISSEIRHRAVGTLMTMLDDL